MWSPGIHPNWAPGVEELGANRKWGCMGTILILLSYPTEGSLHIKETREVSLCCTMLNVSEIHQPWTMVVPASGSLVPLRLLRTPLLHFYTRSFSFFLISHLPGSKCLWSGDRHHTPYPLLGPLHCVLWTAPPTVHQLKCQCHCLFFTNSFTPSVIVILIVKYMRSEGS